MSYTVRERPTQSGAMGTRPSSEKLYLALGSGSIAQLEADLVANIPDEFNNRPLLDITYTEIVEDQAFDVTAIYQQPALVDLTQPGDTSYAFAVTAGSQHITQSKKTVGRYVGSGTFAVDYGGAIGVNSDGTAEGCDIVVAQFAFDETHLFEDDQVTNAFKGIIFRLCATTNNAPFKGLATSEGLFMGATGGKRADTRWEITFNMAGSPNVTNLEIGNIQNQALKQQVPWLPITVASKKGWEYMWVEYIQVELNNGGAPVPVKRMATVPLQVNVEQVYDEGNWSQLGIGT